MLRISCVNVHDLGSPRMQGHPLNNLGLLNVDVVTISKTKISEFHFEPVFGDYKIYTSPIRLEAGSGVIVLFQRNPGLTTRTVCKLVLLDMTGTKEYTAMLVAVYAPTGIGLSNFSWSGNLSGNVLLFSVSWKLENRILNVQWESVGLVVQVCSDNPNYLIGMGQINPMCQCGLGQTTSGHPDCI